MADDRNPLENPPPATSAIGLSTQKPFPEGEGWVRGHKTNFDPFTLNFFGEIELEKSLNSYKLMPKMAHSGKDHGHA